MNIKAGDLVVVVKPLPCCGYDGGVGVIFRVKKISDELGRCVHCGKRDQPGPMAIRSDRVIAQVNRLKRIDPFPELANERQDEEITA